MTTVGEAGESEVLARVLAQLAPSTAAVVGPGDDSAVLQLQGQLVVTSDTMIEGPDFRLAWHSGEELGRKLAATNLSDVAAMGARPIALTVALACPKDTQVALLEAISRGLRLACDELAPGCGVVGGDLSTAPVLTIAITALGDLEDNTAVLRTGARPGDLIAYAGQLGLAGLGLSLLFATGTDASGRAHSDSMQSLRERHPAALAAQLTPRPPIVKALAAARAGATAMMDVSDGLSLDAARLARASDVVLALESAALNAAFGLQDGEQVPLHLMLTGGEDHGMLATFAPTAMLPNGFHVIGKVEEARDDGVFVLVDESPFTPRGWDPYAGAADEHLK